VAKKRTNIFGKPESRAERIKNLAFTSSLGAMLCIASTYAWFIGLQEVNVEDFEVNVASTDSLLLSLNGKDWDSTISFNKDNIKEKVYELPPDENGKPQYPYNWPKKGIVPLSTIGEMDDNVSRMILFEKTSLSTTPGGYKLLATRVNNYGRALADGEKIQTGYLAFDLFVKNFSGTHYIEEEDLRNEEAIFLTRNSKVTLGSLGVAESGIENSVRVAFSHVGRVAAYNNDQDVITSITCASSDPSLSGDTNFITGLCRQASIWEPNDTKHVEAAITWYEKSCLLRTGADNTTLDSYIVGSMCKTVEDGVAYPTYVIKEEIAAADGIDVYDGEEYNGYDVTVADKLTPYKTFTDTDKDKMGMERQGVFTLAPNSITKLRIYIYLEGQDIDNYDYASFGKQVKINFGFSKSREEDDEADESVDFTG
jgi:hypothetical protein